MPHPPNPKIPSELTEAVVRSRQMLADGQSTEEVLSALREDGHAIIQSILIIHNVTGLSLAESKELVHCSGAWSDWRQEHDAFHQSLFEEIDRLAAAGELEVVRLDASADRND